MSDFQGIAYVDIDGKRIEVEHLDLKTELSDKEVFGFRQKECDECGALIMPTKMVMIASTDGESGVYHKECKPK